MYVSEFTEFMQELKARKPSIIADQKKGRAMWWDKAPVTPAEQDRLRASKVPQTPYVYQIKG